MAIDNHGQQIFNGAQIPRQVYFASKQEIPEVEANRIYKKDQRRLCFAIDIIYKQEIFQVEPCCLCHACPLVYIIMHNRLQNFAYKTGIGWWVFIVAGVATFIITLLTVSWQRYKAALQKPTEAIRQE